MRRWVFGAAALVMLALLLSGDTPWRYTAYGLIAPPDLAQDLAAARVFASHENPYQVGIARTHAELMKVPAEQGYPHFPHPPMLFLLLLPIAGLTLSQAAFIWFAVSLGVLFLLAAIIADAGAASPASRRRGTHPRHVFVIFGALLAWPPVLYNLAKGQWSIVLALLLALVWYFHVRGRHHASGSSLGIAVAIKLFPALLGVYLLIRRPKAIVSLVLAVTATLVLPLVWMGPSTIVSFLQQSQANVTYWETFPAVTYSIHGVLARLMVGGQWARPLVHAPVIARVVGTLAALALVVIATRVLRSRTAGEDEGAVFAAWMCVLVALNPLAMAHTGVILALPIVLVAKTLAADHRMWPKLAWTVGTVLVSIPGHTLIFLASQPIEPWQGLLVIALPLWGTLSLFAAAVAATAAPSRQPVPALGLASLPAGAV